MTQSRGSWRKITPLKISDLYPLIKDELRIKTKGAVVGGRGGSKAIFSRIGRMFWEEVMNAVVIDGVDVNIPKFGTIGARRRKSTKIWTSVFGRNFDFTSIINGNHIKSEGKRYTDLDLLNNFNAYPAIFWWNDGGKKYRSVYWKYHLNIRLKYRRMMWDGFFDNKFDYKTIVMGSPYEKKVRKNKMWRNGMLISGKAKV